MENPKKYKWVKIFFIVIIAILILFAYRNLNWYKNKHEIKNLVSNNMDFLNECIENENYDKIYEIKEIENIRKWPLDDNEIYIDFYHHGYGMASNSTYIGFYYVSEDKPTGFQGYSYKLKPKGKGLEWKEPNGDNWYYTEKLADHWYYYEAGF